MPFVKLDTGILDSSLWSEPPSTCKCWITLLAMADSTGMVRATAPGIARRANISLEDTQKALEIFASSDPHSRSINDEGKKIRRVDGGYVIVNYLKYRAIDYTAADRMRRMRQLRSVTRNGCNETVTLRKQKQKQSTEADKEKENILKEKDSSDPQLLSLLEESVHRQRMLKLASKSRPRTIEEVIIYCRQVGLTQDDGEWLYDKWLGNGFTNGGKSIKDWRATIRQWKRTGTIFPSQKKPEPKKRLTYDL